LGRSDVMNNTVKLSPEKRYQYYNMMQDIAGSTSMAIRRQKADYYKNQLGEFRGYGLNVDNDLKALGLTPYGQDKPQNPRLVLYQINHPEAVDAVNHNTLANRIETDVAGKVANFGKHTAQDYHEYQKDGTLLNQNATFAGTGATKSQAKYVPKQGSNWTQNDADYQTGQVRKAAENLAKNTVFPVATTAALPAAPLLSGAAMLASAAAQGAQNTKGGPGAKALGSLRAAWYGPAVDMATDPDIGKKFYKEPVSTSVEAILAGLQLAAPIFGAKALLGDKGVPVREDTAAPTEETPAATGIKPSAAVTETNASAPEQAVANATKKGDLPTASKLAGAASKVSNSRAAAQQEIPDGGLSWDESSAQGKAITRENGAEVEPVPKIYGDKTPVQAAGRSSFAPQRPGILPQLVDIGRQVLAEGSVTPRRWYVKMQDALGEDWPLVKGQMGNVWQQLIPERKAASSSRAAGPEGVSRKGMSTEPTAGDANRSTPVQQQPGIFPQLVDIGRQVLAQGHVPPHRWYEEMRSVLGEDWPLVKGQIGNVWQQLIPERKAASSSGRAAGWQGQRVWQGKA
jgi:hypothetical protein